MTKYTILAPSHPHPASTHTEQAAVAAAHAEQIQLQTNKQAAATICPRSCGDRG